MNPALAGVALAVVVGAIVATSARNARTAVLGLFLTLVGAALVADPLPDSLGLLARLIGSVICGYFLWVATRGPNAVTGGSRLGWPAELLIAAAAALAGYASHASAGPGGGIGSVVGVTDGPALAQAAGFAVAALSAGPIMNGRDVVRMGIGLLLLIVGAVLVRSALGGDPGMLEQLVIAGLVTVVGGTCATLAASARGDGTAGFDLATAGDEHAGHPLDARPRLPGPRSR